MCCRFPYGIKVNSDDEIVEVFSIDDDGGCCISFDDGCIDEVKIEYTKPYLFPMSSMNKKQLEEYRSKCHYRWDNENEPTCKYYYDTVESIDWLNDHHFDYRGLIKKGLAIDCTDLDVY